MPITEELLANIRPVKVRHLPAFLRACEPIATQLMAGDVAGALVDHADELITAVALGADVDRASLEDQTVDELLDLAVKVMEVNADFFARRLLPSITDVAGRIGDAIPAPAGGTNGSTDLSAPVTDTTP